MPKPKKSSKKTKKSLPETKKSKKDTLILGIESSADDTGAAVVKNGKYILSNLRASQTEIHKKYGGIVPEVASRKHIEAIPVLVEEAIIQADTTLQKIDKIAVTSHPGLKPALVVGQSYAQGLAVALNKTLIDVNHLFGHVYANFLISQENSAKRKKDSDTYEECPKTPDFPLITLLVSGGHTQLVFSTDYNNQKILGQTLDDAAGEAFDKVARMLEIGYPGGPIIDRLAIEGDEASIDFPRPLIDSDNYDFSFSGLKTSVKRYIEINRPKAIRSLLGKELDKNFVADVAASFQEAVVDVLVAKTLHAADEMKIENIAIAGGVAANSRLREIMGRKAYESGLTLFYPPIELCIDNAAMIAGAAYHL